MRGAGQIFNFAVRAASAVRPGAPDAPDPWTLGPLDPWTLGPCRTGSLREAPQGAGRSPKSPRSASARKGPTRLGGLAAEAPIQEGVRHVCVLGVRGAIRTSRTARTRRTACRARRAIGQPPRPRPQGRRQGARQGRAVRRRARVPASRGSGREKNRSDAFLHFFSEISRRRPARLPGAGLARPQSQEGGTFRRRSSAVLLALTAWSSAGREPSEPALRSSAAAAFSAALSSSASRSSSGSSPRTRTR